MKQLCLIFLFIFALLLIISGHQSEPAPASMAQASTLPQSVYVWQQNASPELRSAISEASACVDSFYFYSGLLKLDGDRISSEFSNAEWEAIAKSGKRCVAVLRISDSIAAVLRSKTDRRELANAIARHYSATEQKAAARLCRIAELQIDFDCPTSQLARYAILVQDLRADLPVPLSITALPTWMGSNDFAQLAGSASSYVLQVHGIERPRSMLDRSTICEYSKVPGWIAAADRFERPFMIALPTHSYRLIFEANGDFVKFAAEGESNELPAGYEQRIEAADPSEIAKLVEKLETFRPQRLAGIVWFRLPVDSDRLNWSSATWIAVMNGRVPSASAHAEIRSVEPGLDELWLTCSAEQPCSRVTIEYATSTSVAAREHLAGFEEVTYGQLSGPPPRRDEPVLVAWFRSSPSARSGASFVRIQSVTTDP